MAVDVRKLLVKKSKKPAIPVRPITQGIWEEHEYGIDRYISGLASSQGFTGRAGQMLVIPDPESGDIAKVYCGVDSLDDMWVFSGAAAKLPAGTYKIDDVFMPMMPDQIHKASVGWALAHYQYQIKSGALGSDPGTCPRLLTPPKLYREIKNEIIATWAVRDMINAPANILNTKELAQQTLDLAATFNAKATHIKGKKLTREFPLIDAVGRASANKPQLIHFHWKGNDIDDNAQRILLVGKGVTFDTGGVQIKPGVYMEAMKKDMGGAATALGLAHMVMANNLPVHLDVVIPIAENSVSANAFRPLDIITARDGTEIEISHTDAEGRLILADAITYGIEQAAPDLILDFATLTGAQRIADGLEVGGVFSNSKQKGRIMEDIGAQWCDDLQLHHLFEKYRPLLKSRNGGDLASSPKAGGGPGATLAAMFLQHFTRAADNADWFHFDVNGANLGNKPGRPAGGEAMGMRAAYRYIKANLG